MYDPYNNRFEPISPELASKFADPSATLTKLQTKQREWTRFSEGETIEVKGVKFRVAEIGERRLVLKPIDKAAFAESIVAVD